MLLFLKQTCFVSRYYCMANDCKHGRFVPDHCQNTSCALLLAPHYYKTTEFIIQQIKDSKLLVKVVWLGPNLNNVVTEITSQYYSPNSITKDRATKSILILSWTPSEVILDDTDFISVSFKSSIIGGAYEERRLVKLSWTDLQKLGELAFLALHELKFSKEQYAALLRLYNTNTGGGEMRVRDTACQWLRENKQPLSDWITCKNLLHNYSNLQILNGGVGAYSAWHICLVCKRSLVRY